MLNVSAMPEMAYVSNLFESLKINHYSLDHSHVEVEHLSMETPFATLEALFSLLVGQGFTYCGHTRTFKRDGNIGELHFYWTLDGLVYDVAVKLYPSTQMSSIDVESHGNFIQFDQDRHGTGSDKFFTLSGLRIELSKIHSNTKQIQNLHADRHSLYYVLEKWSARNIHLFPIEQKLSHAPSAVGYSLKNVNFYDNHGIMMIPVVNKEGYIIVSSVLPVLKGVVPDNVEVFKHGRPPLVVNT